MLKMVLIAYNEAVDQEVQELLRSCLSEPNYTKVPNTFGRGKSSGTHEGTDIWPGRNSLLYIACTETEAKKIFSGVKDLRKTLGKEGVKAFLQPLEDVTT